MIKQLHLYDILNEMLRAPIAVNFDKVLYYKPNSVNSQFTDIYFSSQDKITVWESYDSLHS